MKIAISSLLPILGVTMLITLSFCGNNANKNEKAKLDSIDAVQAWNKTIPGNFSPQKTIQFDSLAIDTFLQAYPLFSSLDTNLHIFYQKRTFNYAWFDHQGLIEQAGNLVARVSNTKDEGLFKTPPYKQELDSLLLETRMEKPENGPNTQLEIMLTAQYFNFAHSAWSGADKSVSIVRQNLDQTIPWV